MTLPEAFWFAAGLILGRTWWALCDWMKRRSVRLTAPRGGRS